MAAESGKWAAKHPQNPPEKETIVENDPLALITISEPTRTY
ncbi:hypothetical protein [Streptomyces albidoflavus]|nr:hypothetical protein [Streptomyces albidoflavus]